MSVNASPIDYSLKLRAGELVEVRSEAEILSTLDATGRLDALPFMPEMLKFCGKRFRVYKRSHKTCDTIHKTGGRRMRNTVHLEALHCDGSAHGSCQARCLIFWKEAWLNRVHPNFWQRMSTRLRNSGGSKSVPAQSTGTAETIPVTRETLYLHTQVPGESTQPGDETYACQVTELFKASAPLVWWDFQQYFEDYTSGNASFLDIFNYLFYSAIKRGLGIGIGYRAQLWIYNRFQRWTGGSPFPFRGGTLIKTPTETLNLQPGELVQVKSNGEILDTLDKKSRNRGLLFDLEEAHYCGGQYKVLDRVERIINEETGKLTKLPGECIMLEGVVCRALYSDRRAFCPRSVYSYWREIWLRRVD